MAEIYKSKFPGQEIDERLELIPELQEGVVAAQQAADGKYTKPASGIPMTDLSDEVQEAIEEGGGQADWAQTDTTAPDYIKNKPSIPTHVVRFAQQFLSESEQIQARANIGAGTYTKPSGGIPESDLAPGVIPTVPTDVVKYSSQSLTDAEKTQARTNIGAAAAAALTALETAIAAKYTKPSSGIPETDLASGVQSALALARTSIQSLADYYDKTEIDSLIAAVSSEQYVDVATLPTASASTLGKIYLVGPTNGVYERYYTSYDGTTYSWVGVGTTEINLANYATKAELSQLGQKVNEKAADRFGNNIINPAFVEQGYLNSSGVVTKTTSALYVSGFIRVSSGQSVQTFKKVSSSSSILTVAAYDSAFAFLRGVSNATSYTQQGNEVYIRVGFPEPTTAYPTVFANFGNTLLDYEPYISLNSQITTNVADIKKARLADNLIVSDLAAYTKVRCIKSLNIYVPDSISEHSFGISMLGWNTDYKRLYFRIYDKTSGGQDAYFYKEYESKPASGIERLVGFPLSGVMATNGLYYFDITIDWSLCDTYTDSLISGLSVAVFPISKVGEIENNLGTIIQHAVAIPDGTHLRGKGEVTIDMAEAGRFTLGSNCSLEGIKFNYIGSGRIERTEVENDYIFTPIITRADLAAEAAATFWNTSNYAAVVIPNSVYGVKVSGCEFIGFNTCALYDAGGRHQNYNHQVITDNMFINCRTGLLVTEEFSRIIGNYFYGCITGLYLNLGNPNILGNNFVRCDCGVYLSSNQSAHGHIVSCHFAHIGVAALYAKTIGDTLGLIVDGCQIAQGPVIAEYAVGLRLQNCRLDTYFIIADGGKCSITNNNMRMTYATRDSIANIFDVPNDTVITGNRAVTLAESDELYNVS